MGFEFFLILFMFLFWLFFMALAFAGLIFWIVMIVDVSKKKFPNDEGVLWVLVVVLGGVVGAIVYYFLGRTKGR